MLTFIKLLRKLINNLSCKLLKITIIYLSLSSLAMANLVSLGDLSFESKNQSMWGSGASFNESESLFLGTKWTNASATIGGIAGNAKEVIIPPTNAVTVGIYEPRIWIPTPTWSNPFKGYHTGCGCTKQVTVIPATSGFTADTRTGVKLDVNSSGRVGLEFGYTVDSGTIDSEVNFAPFADIPDTFLAAGVVDLNTSSIFNSGTINTQSPNIKASINAILELSGSVNATACAIAFGCKTGSTSIPYFGMNQSVLSIDANSIKILDGILPNDKPLAELPISKTTLTVSGGASLAPPAFGVKVSAHGVTVVNTLPPTPAITGDLASIKLEVPDIATIGSKSGNSLVSEGQDNVLTAHLDIDGVATFSGVLPPAGVKLDLIDAAGIKLQAGLDLMDVDAGPVLGVTQDFELTPSLMVDLSFSNAIEIIGLSGLHTSWSGLWSELPSFSLLETTTFTPEFWIDAFLINKFGLDLGLTGTMDLMKLSASGSAGGVSLINFGPFSLNDILDIDNELFSIDKKKISIYDDIFSIGGFGRIFGEEFTIYVDNKNAGKLISQVNEPATLIILFFGLLWVGFYRNRKSISCNYEKLLQ